MGAVVLAGGLVAMIPGCQHSTAAKLAEDPTVSAIFSAQEIRDIAVILDFFEGQICDMTNVEKDSLTACYVQFFGAVKRARNKGMLYVPIQFPAQRDMYEILAPESFSQFWILGTGVDPSTGEKVNRITLNADGKYMQLLERLQLHYASLDAYVRSFQEERRLSSTMIESVMKDDDRYNINDPAIRLFLAIHYLTINDIYERKSVASGSQGEG